jgi:translation initiation factor 2A
MYNEDMVELYHVTWRPQALDSLPPSDPLHPVPTPHKSALAYLGTVKTPSKPAGAYRPPGARGTSTPLHFKREDEGGAAHIVSNGTSLVGSNGFGRPRRQVPGAEPVEHEVPGAAPANGPVTGVAGDENLSKAALKNKKKRENKKKEQDAQKAAGLTPVPDGPSASGDNRSPDRGNRRDHQRSRSKDMQNQGGVRPRSRTNQTQGQGKNGSNGMAAPAAQTNNLTINSAAARMQDTPELSITSPGGGSPNAKKLRGLQKKIRAIEDLEMRHAGGEKLEDTQMKKIATKASVQAELDALERDG